MSTVFFSSTNNNKLGVRLFFNPKKFGELGRNRADSNPGSPEPVAGQQQASGTQQESTKATTGAVEKVDLAQLDAKLQQGINDVTNELNQCRERISKREPVSTENLAKSLATLTQDVAMTKQAMETNPKMEAPANLEEAEKCINEATRILWFIHLQRGINDVTNELNRLNQCLEPINKEEPVSTENLVKSVARLTQNVEGAKKAMERHPEMGEPENLKEAEDCIAKANKFVEDYGQ